MAEMESSGKAVTGTGSTANSNKSIYSYWMTKKLQMSTFLGDLQNGESFSNAMTRLQTMGALMEQVIQQNIDLYDDEDEELHNEQEQDPVTKHENQDGTHTGTTATTAGKDDHSRKKQKKLRSRSNTVNSSLGMDEDEVVLYNDVVIPRDKQYQEILDSITSEMPTGVEDEQQALRMKIQKIRTLKDISPKIKSLMIQKLMMGKTNLSDLDLSIKATGPSASQSNIKKKSQSDVEEVVPTISKKDLEQVPFSDPFGCEHYLRNCISQCPTCQEWVMCNFCHNEKVHSHEMQRNKVDWIACLYCETVQHPTSQYCTNASCSQMLASYFCDVCKLYDNDDEKDIYHCDKCGICRIGLGLGLDYFHCDTCQACMPIELFDFKSDDEESEENDADHKHDGVNKRGKTLKKLEKNSAQDNVLNDVMKMIGNTTSNSLLSIFEYAQQDRLKMAEKQHICIDGNTKSSCPICGEYMFTSLLPVMYMQPCSHAIHKHCFDEYTKHSYKCPMCQVTIIDMEIQFKILDQEIQEQPLPEPYSEWKCVYKCNDCNARGICQYHILGLKCGDCYSFNTVQLKLIKTDEFIEEELQNLNDYRRQVHGGLHPGLGNSTTRPVTSSSSTNHAISSGSKTSENSSTRGHHNSDSESRMIESILQRNHELLESHFSISDHRTPSINKDLNDEDGNIDNFMNSYLKNDEDLKFSSLAQGFKLYLTGYKKMVSEQQSTSPSLTAPPATHSLLSDNDEVHCRDNDAEPQHVANDTSNTVDIQNEETSFTSMLVDVKRAFTEFIKQQRQLGEDYEDWA
ncbi:hypothetical protein ACO0QE_000107 [Hanseniaspora vineae]